MFYLFQVKDVLKVKYNRDKTREFLIRWKGFGPQDDSWEPEANLTCSDLIEKLMSKEDKVRKAK